jgi:hypothetical protein
MMTVYEIFLMLVEVLCVIYIMCSLPLDVWFGTAIIQESKELMLVKHIRRNGKTSKSLIAARFSLVFVECSNDQLRLMHGNHNEEVQIPNDMMIQMQIPLHQRTTLLLVDITVLKPSVPLVAL